jgi:WD40 repeat protein
LLNTGRLCSGSFKGDARIWSIDSGACELCIDAGCTPFRLAQIRDGRVCSGHQSGDIKFWNILTGVCEMTLKGHAYLICAIVVIYELRICSCSYDAVIKVWNVSTGVCELNLGSMLEI